MVVALAGALLLALVGAGQAHAEAFGELGRVGQFGPALGEFTYPTGLAVDQKDNSVFVVDEPEGQATGPGAGPANFRLQKFSSALAHEASVTIPTPSSGLEEKGFVVGIAVDSELGRVYVLKAIQTGRQSSFEEVAATEIEAYSVHPVAGSLPPAESVSTASKLGVYYVFPTVPNTGPVPPEAVLEPRGFAVEPVSHDLVILGDENQQPTVIWRISGTDTGTLEKNETYRDGGAVEGGSKAFGGPTSLAAGPHDELYLSGNEIGGGGKKGVAELVTTQSAGHSLANPQLTFVHTEGSSVSPPGLTGGKNEGYFRGNGPQLAVSSDGGTVYAAEVSAEQGVNGKGEPTAGSFEVRGMSTSDGSQQIVYGGGSGHEHKCEIASLDNAIATGSGGVVYVLDEGESYKKEGAEFPSPFGFDLAKFGPEGEGKFCAAPATSIAIKVNHNELNPTPAKVEKGELMELSASETELRGATPKELTWKITGSLPPWEAKGPQETHRLLKPGLYTVELNMSVEKSPFGQPPAVTRAIEVTAPTPTASFIASPQSPKSGENVTFNAKESIDPKGACSEATGCTSTEEGLKYTWKFGDGTKVEKEFPESTYSRSFSNTSSQPRTETVELIVTSKEDGQSTPFIEHLTIQGTGTASGGGETGSGSGGTTTTTGGGITTGIQHTIPKPLTNAQKLAKALKACRKIKSHGKRASCERKAKAKYAAKPKKKKKK